MNTNVKKLLFGDGRNKRPPVLLAVTPPRTGERTLLGVENLLQSIAVPEPFSLELAGDADGVNLLARCQDDQVVRSQLSAHYPRPASGRCPRTRTPSSSHVGEQAWGLTLLSGGPEYVPLRTFRDDDLLDPGSDPLLAVIGSLSALRPGERVLARLLLRSLGPDWSQAHQQKAFRNPGQQRPDPSYTYQTKPLQLDGVTMAVLGVGALIALRGYLWVQDGEISRRPCWAWAASPDWPWPVGNGGAGSRPATGSTTPCSSRRRWAASPLTPSYRSSPCCPKAPGSSGHRNSWARWPPPTATTTTPPERGSRSPASSPLFLWPTSTPPVRGCSASAASWACGRSPPCGIRPARETRRPWWNARFPRAPALGPGGEGGAPVGRTTAGSSREIRFPEDLLRRHHLYVARTRMGKSTLMHHVVTHKPREKAAGRDNDAIVVVDPHADLVAGLLEQVPESLLNRVKLIDLADEQGAPGINLLDTRIFADRDRTPTRWCG